MCCYLTKCFIHKLHLHYTTQKYTHLTLPYTTLYTGIDRLERLKGIPLKLMAIDQFVTENPQWLGKIVFGLIGISAVERGQVCVRCVVNFGILFYF